MIYNFKILSANEWKTIHEFPLIPAIRWFIHEIWNEKIKEICTTGWKWDYLAGCCSLYVCLHFAFIKLFCIQCRFWRLWLWRTRSSHTLAAVGAAAGNEWKEDKLRDRPNNININILKYQKKFVEYECKCWLNDHEYLYEMTIYLITEEVKGEKKLNEIKYLWISLWNSHKNLKFMNCIIMQNKGIVWAYLWEFGARNAKKIDFIFIQLDI